MRKILSLLLVLLGTLNYVSAQVTTASMSGRVTNSNREAVVGAVVKATHEPSGSVYGTVAGSDGRYTMQGMRVGGPYKVEISYLGSETAVFNDITLRLGETTAISTNLKESAEMIEDVVVLGNAGIDATKTGAASSMNAEQIGRMPTITGSVADVLKLNPQISVNNNGAMFFAGANNRYNSFQIDGAMNNDVFGLTASGSNGGQAGTQPVSMETIEQLQVSIAPYDVRQSGFTGGAVNAITKSGTNTFHGNVYGFGNSQALIGKYTMKNGNESAKWGDQTDYRAGVTFGGPIVKNKLFFFANYEKTNKTKTNPYGLGATASRVDETTANQILAKLKEMAADQGINYNVGYSTMDNYTKSDKAGVKLDWNINDRNKASFRWGLVSAKQLNANSTAGSLTASDQPWDFVSKTNSFIFELQSRFSDKVSNEFRASYVRVRDQRIVGGDPFPMITIRNVGDNGGSVVFGNERSSVANRLDQDIISFTDNVSVHLGRHDLTFGTHNEFYNFANLFIQNNYGVYAYNSVDDFYADKISEYRYKQANVDVTGNPRWEASLGAAQFGLYAQDKWNVTDRLDVTLGVRMDIPVFFDTPSENKPFNDYAASKGWNYKTDSKISSAPLFSPRLGFRYNIDEDRKLVLRGGAGIFTGRIPFVWISNNFSETGIQMSAYELYNATDIQNAGLSLVLDPNKQKENTDKMGALGNQVINVFDKKFKFAQNLKINLGLDFEAAGIDWTAEAIYSKTLNDILYEDLAYAPNGKTLDVGVNSDNRPMLERVTGGTDFTHIYALSNTSKGYTYSLSLMGEKNFGFGLDVMASYTFTQSKSLNSGTSSVAQSNWVYNYTHGNPNDPELGFSAFNFPHRVNASVFYNKSYGRQGRWATTVGLIYTGSSGSPYSLYYSGDINGDGSNANDLMFIPTDAQIDQMSFRDDTDIDATKQKANMKAWIAADPYLSEHRGEYYERYAANEKFEHQFDFHFAQRLDFNVDGRIRHSLELTFDILNAANLFSKEWGRHGSYAGSATYFSPVNYSGGQFQFLQNANYNMHDYSDEFSRWRAQIGLRYSF